MNSSFLSYFQKCEPQILRFWDHLSKEHRILLENQLQAISLDLLEKQKQLIFNSDSPDPESAQSFEPFDTFCRSGNKKDQLRGEQLIQEGRLGCLLLAGGQGTRLQFQGPKGTYPISLIKNKSLFQLCVEKIKAAGERAGRPLNLAIMTSLENDLETRSFFQNNHFFGLNPECILFFTQTSLPLLDSKGQLFLENPWRVACGSDGNGHSLLCFVRSGILEQWKKKGIEYIHVLPVDNPLTDPFDAELLGCHERLKVEVTLKCTGKLIPDEKVGVLVTKQGHPRVIEYSEMPPNLNEERYPDGSLKYSCANLSLFCFSLSFIERNASQKQSLPLHKAWKTAQYVDEEGISKLSTVPMAWKFETFIFDWLMYTDKVAALIYPRELCFAPLKNASGKDSLETVRAALLQKDRFVISALTGLPCPDFPIELAAEFYYPTPSLIAKWRGKNIESGYLEA